MCNDTFGAECVGRQRYDQFDRFRRLMWCIATVLNRRSAQIWVLWFMIPTGSIERISIKSFVDDLILGRGDVSFRAVLCCELLSPIPN